MADTERRRLKDKSPKLTYAEGGSLAKPERLGSSTPDGGFSDTGRWIGKEIRAERLKNKWTLEVLSARTSSFHPEGKPISPAYISRIESRGMLPHLQELIVLCNAFGTSLERVLPHPTSAPWFVVRRQTAERLLRDVIKGDRKITRRGDAHEYMIQNEFYNYEPLDDNPDCVNSGEAEGKLEPQMRKCLFHASDRATVDDMKKGLGHHSGEEMLVVLEGEMEAWLATTQDPGPANIKKLTLGVGDTLHFSSQIFHAFRGTAGKPSRALFVFSETGTTSALVDRDLLSSSSLHKPGKRKVS
jgi:transcriptional regulator with XRE-family HTH domain